MPFDYLSCQAISAGRQRGPIAGPTPVHEAEPGDPTFFSENGWTFQNQENT